MFPNVGIISLSTLEYYDLKKLYYFFDKQGIFLTIEMYKKNNWLYTISFQNNAILSPSQESKTSRESCEREGFLECFKILEKKLVLVCD